MSDVVVRIPAALRAFTEDASEIGAAAGTVAEVLQQLTVRHPDLAHRVLAPDGKLRPFVNV